MSVSLAGQHDLPHDARPAGASSVLERIVSSRRRDVALRRMSHPESELRRGLERSTRSLADALLAGAPGFIMECKGASPSRGSLRPSHEPYDPVELARAYAPMASAISVLTESRHFCGALEHLRAVRDAVDLPIICKDFIVEPSQIVEARAYGADAVLLMASVLPPVELRSCLTLAEELGLDALVEVHDDSELERVAALGARLIGINNRNLKTLEVDLKTTEALAPKVARGVVRVAESGVRDHADVRRLRGRVDAFLVGTSLVTASNPAAAARALVHGRVKVCGLTRRRDAAAALRAGATHGGLVFASESRRRVTPEQAEKIIAAAPSLEWVGVFVDDAPDQVERLARQLGLSAVQLHGNETPGEVRALRETLSSDSSESCEVWKAYRIGLEGDLSQLERSSDSTADRLLLDTNASGCHGGSGTSFDWSMLAALPHARRRELILAGGLNAENAVKADALGMYALDVSSGVESLTGGPGIKDQARLRTFFASLRSGMSSGAHEVRSS